MAEGLLRHLLKQKGHNDVQVMSAGVSAIPGSGATLETVEVMQAEGIDVSGHMGQPASPDLVRHADVIFCMEDFHRELILSQVPEVEPKIHLLRTFKAERPVLDANIPDPIGRPKEVYESCLMTIKESIQRIVRWLEKQP